MESNGSRVLELEERVRQLELQNLELLRQKKDSRSSSPFAYDADITSERADPFELDLLNLDEIEEKSEDEWLYVSPVKLPTPAQRKIRVSDWLEQDTDDDVAPLPPLHSVRQSLSFHNHNADSRHSIASAGNSLPNFDPSSDDSVRPEPTIPIQKQNLEQANHKSQDNFGHTKLSQPHGKVIKGKITPAHPVVSSVGSSHQKTQEEDAQALHNTDDDELWEFQQIEEEVELDEFAEVEAMINEGHVAEAGEELLHGIHLTNDQHTTSENIDPSDLDLKTNLTSLSQSKVSGIKPATHQEHGESRLLAKQGPSQTKRGSSKLPVNYSKKQSGNTAPLPQPISRVSEKSRPTHRSYNHTSEPKSSKSMLPTVSNATKQRQPQRSIRPPSKLVPGTKNSRTTARPQVNVNGNHESLDIVEDESWKEGCF